MKKRIAFLFLTIFFIASVGCTGRIYALPHDQFCYSERNENFIELELTEKEYLIALLNNGNWYGETAKCSSDYTFYTKSQTVGYNAEEGIFNDFTLNRSLKISEKDRVCLNGYLSGDE